MSSDRHTSRPTDPGTEPVAGEPVAREPGRRRRAQPGETAPSRDEATSESRQSLWLLAAAPTIWAVHFLASYITGAIWCAKAGGPFDDLGWVPVAVAVYTVIALAGIGVVGAIGWRRHDYGTAAVPHDFDTGADRHRFLGFATVLLAGLSAVAVLFVAAAAAFFQTCR